MAYSTHSRLSMGFVFLGNLEWAKEEKKNILYNKRLLKKLQATMLIFILYPTVLPSLAPFWNRGSKVKGPSASVLGNM